MDARWTRPTRHSEQGRAAAAARREAAAAGAVAVRRALAAAAGAVRGLCRCTGAGGVKVEHG
eukprot:scaffold121767_cov66-Phaeocystis_antarctica.AAC.3